MAVYTNMTTHLINMPDGTQLPPGVAVEVPADVASSDGMKAMVENESIIAGPPPEKPAEPVDQPSPPLNTGPVEETAESRRVATPEPTPQPTRQGPPNPNKAS